MLPKVDVVFYRYDDVLLFKPILPVLEKAVTIREKKLVPNPPRPPELRIVKRTFLAKVLRSGEEVASTYPGFMHMLVNVCIENNITFFIRDMRVAQISRGFPAPDFSLMGGFRFSQERLVREALSKDQSGLIGAPTRYGKTTLMVNIMRAFPTLPTVVTAPGVDLCRQLYDDITGERGITGREVKLICSGSKTRYPSETGITVCSADSLDKCDKGGTQLLLADEPHQLVTDARLERINAFTVARRYGFGATLTGRFDGRDILIPGLFGPVLSEITYTEAVAEGAICPLTILFININISDGYYNSHNTAYNKLLFHNKDMAAVVARICNEMIPEDFQTLIFIKNEKQADLYMPVIGEDTTVAMAKKMSDSERQVITDKMRDGSIKRCLCSNIYVQGVTFPDVRVLINCEGGGNNTSAIQKPGRLAQVRDGKKCGIIIDFAFHCLSERPGCAYDLERDSEARRTAYLDKGYTIIDAFSFEEAVEKFNSLI